VTRWPALLVALAAAACASAPPGPTAETVAAEARRYDEEMTALYDRVLKEGESLALESRWAARFEELARSEDPGVADAAYESVMLVLGNLWMAQMESGGQPDADTRYLDAAEAWVRRIPDSKRIGAAASLLFNVAQEELLLSRSLDLLRRLADSPHEEVRRSALYAQGQVLQEAGREDEAAAALERVVREFPGTPEADMASKDLRRRGIRPGAEAPDFNLADLSGERVRLSSLRGKAVLLNFWGMG